MIIHILGRSGAGKTTLGKKLSKLNNTVSLDTDDIDDVNSLKLLKKYNIENKSEDKAFNEERAKLNREELSKFIAKNASKNIVFVGFDFPGMENIPKLAGLKYSIKIDPDVLFRQYNLRTLYAIQQNFKEIESLLQNDSMSIEKIRAILLYKYKIRQGLNCIEPDELKKGIKRSSKRDKEKGYKVKTSDQIYEDIIKKLEIK